MLSGRLGRSRRCRERSLITLGAARSCSPLPTQVSASKFAWPALGWLGRKTISRLVRELAPVRSSTSRPIAGSRVAKLERKSATPWRTLALISMGIARFGFGAARGQLRRRSSKLRRSLAHDLRVAVRRRPRPGNAYTGSLAAAGFSRSIDGGSTGRRPPQLPRARTHGSGIPGRGQPNGTGGATPDLSQMSDADLKAIATQGPSGATGRWSDAPLAHQWSSAPLAPVTSRSFADVERAFPPASDLSSVSDEALRKIAGSNGTAALRGAPRRAPCRAE